MKLILLQSFTTNLWLQMLLLIIFFALGWIFARLFKRNSFGDCCEELKTWKDNYSDLEMKYNSVLTSNVITKPINSIPELLNLGNDSRFDPYNKLKKDNLQIIEGVGPKMELILQKNKIKNWKSLASKTPDDLRKILDKENNTRYKIIDPSTWSDQAQLAVNGKFQELIEMQKTLNTGKTDAINETTSKLEQIMIKLGLIKRWKKDDLKAIEGIGPMIEKIFSEAGIKTWDDLADAKVDKLKEILQNAGSKYKLANPSTWPTQAELAAEGRWRELKAYQDLLDGGR